MKYFSEDIKGAFSPELWPGFGVAERDACCSFYLAPEEVSSELIYSPALHYLFQNKGSSTLWEERILLTKAAESVTESTCFFVVF